MNIKRLFLAIIVGWAMIFGTDTLIHGLWLGPLYHATQALWRPETEMTPYIPWMFFAQFLVAATFVVVWAKGFAGRGAGEGVIFGLLLGIFQQTWAIILY